MISVSIAEAHLVIYGAYTEKIYCKIWNISPYNCTIFDYQPCNNINHTQKAPNAYNPIEARNII